MVVSDRGYGESTEFRDGLEARQLTYVWFVVSADRLSITDNLQAPTNTKPTALSWRWVSHASRAGDYI
jgi:hypothetical protein